ncbi:HAMP domain-containing histidine kinase [Actinosynnema pretiosum subsp. pretiosum]|uniref:Signal transduction histidine-protein kinase/phosphatase MprB n=1 Tax=Actinosynnema pretiosum subsp. pretiosum TaxID=103721 RepID=A0AA45L2Z3_9PSEU|nr:putative two-component system sensor kinase [Actinosynnema pretiosum subsp. pretiosum]QUF02529.1 HAMP domain-containing histidine kinase [Actinosynnema pretiosum subsp. pretiosum]
MRSRILRAILVAVAVTGIVLGLPLGYTALRLVDDSAHGDLASRAQRIAALIDDQIAGGSEIDLRPAEVGVPVGGHLVVTSPDGVRELGEALAEDALSVEVPIAQQGTVRLEVSARPMRTDQYRMAALVVLLLVLSVGTGTVVATVTAQKLARPLRHVASRAARLGAGDFRADPRRHDIEELDRLAEALDRSAVALAQLVQRERELVGDVSHQLRSRLTALQLRLEALAEHPEPETAGEARAALEQAERLTEVLNELLAAARAARAIDAEPLDLHGELTAIAEEWREQLKREGRGLRVRVPEGLLARATPARLREAIGVLLDNALRHGEGQVQVTARSDDGTVVVEVADGGSGVPDELAGHIFERGVSGGGSFGVGLALARALVDADGGRLELSTARPATFAVFLPVPKAEDVLGVTWRTDVTPR